MVEDTLSCGSRVIITYTSYSSSGLGTKSLSLVLVIGLRMTVRRRAVTALLVSLTRME